MKHATLDALIKDFAKRFKKGATDLNDPTTAAMFASELATKINRWLEDKK